MWVVGGGGMSRASQLLITADIGDLNSCYKLIYGREEDEEQKMISGDKNEHKMREPVRPVLGDDWACGQLLHQN